MKNFFKIFFLFLLSLNLFSNENNIDSITLSKVKKLILKEEEIAFAYKKYILEKGTNPTSLSTLITNNYLPKGFSNINPFGKEMEFDTSKAAKDNKKENKLESSIPENLKTNLFDYYYSSKYRTYTKAPFSINNNKIEIKLSSKENFIYTNQTKITTTATGAISKYYLDTNSILHWYGDDGKYKFSVAKDLLVDESVPMLNTDGSIDATFKNMISDVIFSGQTILHKNSTSGKAEEYLAIDEETIIKKNVSGTTSSDIALLQFGKQSGGMIVNGDIYTWGNNLNRITGINLNKYTNSTGSSIDSTIKNPVITTLVKAKAKVYDVGIYEQVTNNSTNKAECQSPIGSGSVSCKYSSNDCNAPTGSGTILCKDIGNKYYEQNYFSSPFRPKFVDLFANTKNGTCGITDKGELFCGGTTAPNYTFGTNFTHVDAVRNGEMLYRSTFFDGSTNKAKKLFANNQLWLILAEDGNIYRWGTEDTFKNGFSGDGISSFNAEYKKENKLPEKITENISSVSFKDISYIFGDGYKKMGALSNTKDIYIWGMDENNSEMNCTKVSGMNLCQPTKVDTSTSNLSENLTFESIQGGVRNFISLASDGNYYKISQGNNNKIQVDLLMSSSNVLSIDLTKEGTIVYINTDNQLISTYFNSFDTTFKNTINGMSWKSIKVLDDENDAMCGVNTDNQMYCWGIQSYTDSTNPEANTYMLPVFNTNLFDSTKDYMVAENGNNNTLTVMTSGTTWLSNGKFNIKYPTYIGGFNYEFTFK